jgi:hypothetical protein
MIPPVEAETIYYDTHETPVADSERVTTSL